MDLQAFEKMLQGATVVDLGQVLQEDIPVWFTHPHFIFKQWEYKKFGADSNNYSLTMGDHNGTHMDSSYHFFRKEEGGHSIDEYAPDVVCGPCRVLHMHGYKAEQTVEKDDIVAWEAEHGPIEKGDIVLFDFGWSKLFKPLPEGAPFLAGWPGVGASAAQYLADKEVKAVGVDPCAVDCSGPSGNVTHKILLPKEILIIECLANLDKLPDRAYFVALPLRIKNGSGSPLRPIAIY